MARPAGSRGCKVTGGGDILVHPRWWELDRGSSEHGPLLAGIAQAGYMVVENEHGSLAANLDEGDTMKVEVKYDSQDG